MAVSTAMRAQRATFGKVSKKATRSAVVRASTTGSSRVQTNVEYLKSLPGITEPFGNVFDPANLAATATVADINLWRESEITHGRVAMLAAVGFIVGEQLEDFPLFFNFDGHITGPAITQFQQVRQGFWEPLLIAIGIAESYRVGLAWATPTGTGFNALKDEYTPGDLGFDPLGLKPTDPEELKTMQTKELNNGRLAMISIAGFVLQELVPPHREIFEHLALYAERELVLEIEDLDPALNIALPVIPQ